MTNLPPALPFRVLDEADSFGAAPPSLARRVSSYALDVLLHERQCRTHGGLSACNFSGALCAAYVANETPEQIADSPQSPFLPSHPSQSGSRAWPERSHLVEVSRTQFGVLLGSTRKTYRVRITGPIIKAL